MAVNQNTNEQIPAKVYRGVVITGDLLDEVALGDKSLLPIHVAVNEIDGVKIAKDGNEVGVYTSDNPNMPEELGYGNPDKGGRSKLLEGFEKITIGPINNSFKILEPSIGIIYEIDTYGIPTMRRPHLFGPYGENNGMSGKEWIANRIPSSNYVVKSVKIGKSLLYKNGITIDITNDPYENRRRIYSAYDECIKHLTDMGNFVKTHPEIAEKIGNMSVYDHFSENQFETMQNKASESIKTDFMAVTMIDIFGKNGYYYRTLEEIDQTTMEGKLDYLIASEIQKPFEQVDMKKLYYLNYLRHGMEYFQQNYPAPHTEEEKEQIIQKVITEEYKRQLEIKQINMEKFPNKSTEHITKRIKILESVKNDLMELYQEKSEQTNVSNQTTIQDEEELK